MTCDATPDALSDKNTVKAATMKEIADGMGKFETAKKQPALKNQATCKAPHPTPLAPPTKPM